MKFIEDLSRDEIGNLRAHRLSGSRIKKIMTGSYKTWNKLADELRDPPPYYSSTSVPALRWGLDHERRALMEWWERNPTDGRMAFDAFAFWSGATGYDEHIGVTPDALVVQGDKILTGVEGKCPYNPAIHESYIPLLDTPAAYKPQVQFAMWVCDVPEWHFTSFDPRRDDQHRSVDIHTVRDYNYIEEMEEKAFRFLNGLMTGEVFKPRVITINDLENAL